MQQRLLLSVLLTASFIKPANATTWRPVFFADAFDYSQVVVVAEVTEIIRVRPYKQGVKGPHRGFADISVRAVEHLKGRLPADARVTALDLGDPRTMVSRHKPLPEDLVGRRLLLFLNTNAENGSYKARFRFLVDGGSVYHTVFDDLKEKKFSLAAIREMVAQLNHIRAACSPNKNGVRSEKAAIAACRKAINSQYAPVVMYGARMLRNRQIPADFLPDLIALLESQDTIPPVARVTAHCLARLGDEAAVPPLIEFLWRIKGSPRNYHAVNALRALTHQDFGDDVYDWEDWWHTHQKQKTERRDEERPNQRVQSGAAVEDAGDADAREENNVE